MWIAENWRDYGVIDAGDGEKLENWGPYVLRRPDPQVIWPASAPQLWQEAHAHYLRAKEGGGHWEFAKKVPEAWQIRYRELTFQVRPTGFKHTGLFPEQAVNWDWMAELIGKAQRPIEVLNLFAYTGGATAACAAAGASVTHLDAAKGMVQWAKENLALSGLGESPVRYIIDDAMKFVLREGRRGRRYDAIVMDPPSYGRGAGGQVWTLEDMLYPLVEACVQLLSEKPLFVLINSYTTGLQAGVLGSILTRALVSGKGGHIQADEVGLPVMEGGGVLPCGCSGRWWA